MVPVRAPSAAAFVAKTTALLAAWQSAPLDALNLVALLIDGVHLGDHCLIVALGIAADGQKHALGLWDGSTENATVCQGLLANLQSRGLRTDRSLLVILDRSSDQGAVWNMIAEKASRLDARSQTSALSAMFDNFATPLEEFVGAFPPLAHQVGAVFFINGLPAGLDRFDAGSSWRKLAPKLVRSYALDAIDKRGRAARPVDVAAARAFATVVEVTPTSVFPAIGEGDDVRLTGADTAGAAVVAGGLVIHPMCRPPVGAHFYLILVRQRQCGTMTAST